MKAINHYLIGERIRRERKKKNLTQAELGEHAELSTNYIGCMGGASRGVLTHILKLWKPWVSVLM